MLLQISACCFIQLFKHQPHIMLDDMDIHQKNALGYTPLAELRPHLKVVFDQFLLAYKLL